jgi:2-polyprenyl-6-methoxyphenol hydroxylase-like FAD-dependent oxidoreductase
VLAAGDAPKRLEAVRWGIQPEWSNRPLLNARSDKLASSRTWKHLATDPAHRVLFLADGWYEWLRAEKKTKGAPRFCLVIHADIAVGADGSRSIVREAVCGSLTNGFFREHPFAWFGILCEAEPSSRELIYSNSSHGFALISQRSATVQRMYLQCDPELAPDAMTDAQIWEQLQARVAPLTLHEGPIIQRDVLRFRSFVARHLRNGRVALVGDAAHTVPPTGAKGMNLAIADVVVLADAVDAWLRRGDQALMDSYEEDVLPRIWKAQQFSWWMTSMLHLSPDATEFDRLGARRTQDWSENTTDGTEPVIGSSAASPAAERMSAVTAHLNMPHSSVAPVSREPRRDGRIALLEGAHRPA